MVRNEKRINYPPRLDLARLPTPLEPLRRISQELDVELYVKRDDLTGLALSGNKVRKLEFVLADALSQGADTVLTCGGAQSNHARATAVAAARLGLGCRLILRTPDPANPPAIEGNTLLDRLAGAEIRWVTPQEYAQRDDVFEQEATLLRKAGRRPYLIPEGASNARRCLGLYPCGRGTGRRPQQVAGGARTDHDRHSCDGFGRDSCRVDIGDQNARFEREGREHQCL